MLEPDFVQRVRTYLETELVRDVHAASAAPASASGTLDANETLVPPGAPARPAALRLLLLSLLAPLFEYAKSCIHTSAVLVLVFVLLT